MKIPKEELSQLIAATDEYYAPENDAKYEPRLPRNRRAFYHLVGYSPDRSFLECGAAIKIAGTWYLNLAGVARWVDSEYQKTLRACA